MTNTPIRLFSSDLDGTLLTSASISSTPAPYVELDPVDRHGQGSDPSV